jgi:hypothetical protein
VMDKIRMPVLVLVRCSLYGVSLDFTAEGRIAAVVHTNCDCDVSLLPLPSFLLSSFRPSYFQLVFRVSALDFSRCCPPPGILDASPRLRKAF